MFRLTIRSNASRLLIPIVFLLHSHASHAQFPPTFPQPDVQWSYVHEGDLVLGEGDGVMYENCDLTVNGNVYLSGNAMLVLRQCILRINHYPRQEMFVSDSAMLIADTCVFYELVHAFFNNRTQLLMQNCLFINLLQLDGESTANISDSYIFQEPFGLLQPGEMCNVNIDNSMIGAIGLNLPGNLSYAIDSLLPGFFTYWSARDELSPDLPYNLVLTNCEVKDNPGYSGGYEMGWNLMLSSSTDLTITNSVLNKIIINFSNENVEFSGLVTREPVDFSYRDISLASTTIQNQWGIFVNDGQTIISNSEGIWLWPIGNQNTYVFETAVNEFDPRDYYGTVEMQECTMTNGFEVYENCDFRLEGGVRMLDTSPLWQQDNTMIRNYRVQLLIDSSLAPMTNILLNLKKDGEVVWTAYTNPEGWADFDIAFNFQNHLDSWRLGSDDADIWLDKDINIWSITPQIIAMEPAPDGIHLRQVVYADDSNPFLGIGIAPDPFQDLNEAMKHCSRKGIVKAAPGTYGCDINLRDEVTLMGAGPDSTILQGDAFAWDVADGKITGFRIDDGNTAGIHCYGSSVTITNNVITGQPHHGILCSHSQLQMINNTITGNGLSGVFITDTSTVEIRNNIISDNAGFGIQGENIQWSGLDYNDVWENDEGNYGEGITPGPNDISADPLFADTLASDYRLQEGSPCIDAGDPDPAYNDPGGSRNDMGAFGGPGSNSPGQTVYIGEWHSPGRVCLSQNYPNPFNRTTIIRYELPCDERVELKVFNLLGEEVRTLVAGYKPAGTHAISWDASDNSGKRVAEGIYIYRLSTTKSSFIRKMVHLD